MAAVQGFDRSVAILVGINGYRKGVPSLRTPCADVMEIAQRLRADHAFDEAEVITEQEATLDGLRSLLNGLKGRVRMNDRMLFYFAGHGIAVDGDDGPRGYLLPFDADSINISRYMPMIELSKSLSELPCRHMLVVLDCCFAGAFRWSSGRNLLLVPQKLYLERYHWFVREAAWQAISSAAHNQKALDVAAGEPLGIRDDSNESEHSPFARALLDGLAGAADRRPADGSSGDNVITATELYLYLRERLEPPASSAHQRQTPSLWPLAKHDKGEFVFLVPGCEPLLQPAPSLDLTTNPWRGLTPYREADSELFFGRSQAAASLAERVSRSPLTVVVGPSGIGKSSLVMAGLMPRLRHADADNHQPNGAAWKIVGPLRPGALPFLELASAITLSGVINACGSNSTVPPPSLLAVDGHALVAWMDTLPTSTKLLIVVDQLEELITMSRGVEDLHRFAMLLENALGALPDRVRVVLTVRSDFEPQFLDSALRLRWVAARFPVPQMTQDELRRVIEWPATVRVVRFQSGELVDRLINDVLQMPGALPLLSFALSQMYLSYISRRADDRTLGEVDYDRLDGGASGAMRARADREFLGLEEPHRRTARRVLERLVSVESGEWARRRVPETELVFDYGLEDERVRAVLDRFIEARLLVAGRTESTLRGKEDGRPAAAVRQFEFAHDVLIYGWNRLLPWLREDSASLVTQRRLAADASSWHLSGRAQPDLLWDDPARGTAVKSLLGSEFPGLNQVEREFSVASIKRARRNRRIRSTVVIMLVVITIGALLAAGLAWDRARISLSRQLAGQSLAIAENELDVALLLSVAAIRERDTLDARHALFANLQRAGHLTRFIRPEIGIPVIGAINADGSVVALGFKDGRISFYDFARGKVDGPSIVAHSAAITALVFDNVNQRLVTSGLDGKIKFWNRGNPAPMEEVDLPKEVADTMKKRLQEYLEIDISIDGRTIVVGGGGLVYMYKIEAKRWSTISVRASSSYITRVAFNPKNEDILAVTWSDGEIDLWNYRTGQLLFPSLHAHEHEYIVQTHDPHNPVGDTVEHRTDAPITALAFSHDGKLIATGGQDGRAVVWDVAGGKLHGQAINIGNAVVSKLAFSANDHALFVGYLGQVQAWDFETGNPIGATITGQKASKAQFVTASELNRLVSIGQDNVGFWAWGEWSLGLEISRDSVSGLADQSENVQHTMPRAVAFVGTDENNVLTSSRDAKLVIWDLSDPTKSRVLLPGDKPLAPRVANEPTLLATHENTVALVAASELSLWNMAGIEVDALGPPVSAPYGISRLSFTPDGGKVIGTSSNWLHTFNIAERKWSGIYRQAPTASDSVLSADGNVAAFVSDKQVLVTNSVTADIRFQHEFDFIVRTVALSFDGALLAVDRSTSIEVWDTHRGELLQRIEDEGEGWIIRQVQFSPDGRYLTVWHPDYSVTLWDISSGQPYINLKNREQCCSSLWAFDSRAARLVEAGVNGISVWPLEIEAWDRSACRVANRSLTKHESERFVRSDKFSSICDNEVKWGIDWRLLNRIDRLIFAPVK